MSAKHCVTRGDIDSSMRNEKKSVIEKLPSKEVSKRRKAGFSSEGRII